MPGGVWQRRRCLLQLSLLHGTHLSDVVQTEPSIQPFLINRLFILFVKSFTVRMKSFLATNLDQQARLAVVVRVAMEGSVLPPFENFPAPW